MTQHFPIAREMPSVARIKHLYDRAASLAKIGAWECVLATQALTWTDGVYDLFQLPRGSVLKRSTTVDMYYDESRRQMESMRTTAIRDGGSFTLDARIRTARGVDRWMRLTAEVAYVHGRPVRLFGAKQDVTHEMELWSRLRQLAERDALTGLANRGVFEARWHELVTDRSGDGCGAALVLIDLDHFKPINDRFGHAAGDECLRQVAMRLHRAFADSILVARIGGDEFAILLRAPLDRARMVAALERVLRTLCRPVMWNDASIEISASIGVTFPRGARCRTPRDMFAEADLALYAAKAAGRNAVRAFGEEIGDGPQSRPPDATPRGRIDARPTPHAPGRGYRSLSSA